MKLNTLLKKFNLEKIRLNLHLASVEDLTDLEQSAGEQR